MVLEVSKSKLKSIEKVRQNEYIFLSNNSSVSIPDVGLAVSDTNLI